MIYKYICIVHKHIHKPRILCTTKRKIKIQMVLSINVNYIINV